MKKFKVQGFLIMVLPLLISFDYVVAHKILEQVYSSNYNSVLFERFFFVIITSALAQLFWLISIFLVWRGALEQLHTWRMLTIMLIFQEILVYGLGVYMSFLLSDSIKTRDSGGYNDTIEYYIVWSAVCVGCLWFIFLVFLFIIIGHVYQKQHLKPFINQQPSKVY